MTEPKSTYPRTKEQEREFWKERELRENKHHKRPRDVLPEKFEGKMIKQAKEKLKKKKDKESESSSRRRRKRSKRFFNA